MRKRIISTLMALCMALTLLPVQVLAANYAMGEDAGVSARALAGTAGTELKADNIDAYIANGLGNGVYMLAEDVTISGTLKVTGTVTLDLNDHVLTITGEDSFITVSGRDTNMTLTDSAETKTQRRFSTNQDGAWVPDENGDKTVSGGVITGGKAGVDTIMGTPDVNSGVCIENYGTLTVTDGTVNAPIRNIRGTIAGSGTFNGTVINEDKLTGGTFNGLVANYIGQEKSDATISGGIFYGTVANGYNYYTANGEEGFDGRQGGQITNGTFYGKVTNAFSSEISGGSFYGEVDNRDRSDFRPMYRGILAGGTFYAGHPGTVADGCCTVTYDDGQMGGTYAIQIVQTGETAVKPDDPKLNGSDFGGWLESGAPYDFSTPVTGAVTLKAQWRKVVPGSGTKDDPYLISNAEELQAFRDIVNGENGQTQNTAAWAVLTADIDLQNQLWTPIGSQQAPYSGTFDGGGYAIRNLYINNSEEVTGLFGSARNAAFRNLTITGSVTAAGAYGSYSGGLLGIGIGTITITDCINAAAVTSNAAAGLVGEFRGLDQGDSLTITGCANLGTVTAKALRAGIIGQICGVGLIADCYNAGEIKSSEAEDTAFAGGIAAWVSLGNGDPAKTMTFRGCYNAGTLKEGNEIRTGGIVGRVTPGYTLAAERYRLENCYYLDTTADKAAGGDYTVVGEAAPKTAAAFADGTVLTGLIAGRADSEHPWDTGCGSKRLSGGDRLPVLAWQKLSTEHAGGKADCASGAICEYCGKPYGDKDAANHTGGTEVRNARAATCTADGYTGDTHCKGCGDKLQSGAVIKATGHTGGTEVRNARAATCTGNGYTGDTYCKTCGDKLQSGAVITATGHTWGAWTSNGNGTHTRRCGTDGCTGTETADCAGGTATCTAKAVCSVCGQSYGAVDTANHDLKHTAAKEPGAFVTGRIEYWTCRTCGKYFADAGGAKEISRDDIIIPRLGAAPDSEGGKASPATFDAGIGVSAATAVTSLAGLALLRRKRRDGE